MFVLQLPALFPIYRTDLSLTEHLVRVFLMPTQLTLGAYRNSKRRTIQLLFVKMELGQGFQSAFQVRISKYFLSMNKFLDHGSSEFVIPYKWN